MHNLSVICLGGGSRSERKIFQETVYKFNVQVCSENKIVPQVSPLKIQYNHFDAQLQIEPLNKFSSASRVDNL